MENAKGAFEGSTQADTTVAPKRPARKVKPAPEVKAAAKAAGPEKLYNIVLHDSKEIPPNGQMIGVNGKQYFMKPGVMYSVPRSVLEVLNNAVHGVPDVDDDMRVVGVRNAPRLPYTLHPD